MTTHADTIEQLNGKEKGLIKHLSRRNFQLAKETEQHKHAKQLALNMIAKYSPGPQIQKRVFEYLDGTMTWRHAYALTHIDGYENKQGKRFDAHYNQNGKYIRKVQGKNDPPFYLLTLMPVEMDTAHKHWRVEYGSESGVKLIPIEYK